MTWATLRMSMDAQHMHELLPGEEGFLTGHMGECVTVVVLWHHNAASDGYTYARGLHCWGYVTADHWNALLQGVPNTPFTHVVAVGGTIDNPGDGERDRITAALRARGYTNIMRTIRHSTNASIASTGDVVNV